MIKVLTRPLKMYNSMMMLRMSALTRPISMSKSSKASNTDAKRFVLMFDDNFMFQTLNQITKHSKLNDGI